MLAEPIDPEETSPEALLERYATHLAAVIESVGAERAIEADVEPEVVATIEGGGVDDVEDLDLREAATVLALRPDAPDAETLLVEVRDHLLLGMSNAMLTVDRIAADIEDDLEPKEIQAKVEGRLPMTLGEYARLHHFVAARR